MNSTKASDMADPVNFNYENLENKTTDELDDLLKRM